MKSRAQYRKGCLRTLVLKIISERPMYGYEIASVLAKRSDNIFSLGQGTLYPLLYSLEKKRLISAFKKVKDENSERTRLYYKLTAKGEEILEEDLATWADVVKGMALVLRSGYAKC
ncbi:MAG TPA: PadR family transcriptional regulator [Sedimentisphaerales bacterium]|nr:PadR family transcriptional regulator [Sedimentisphaerales bacterium]